MNLMDAFRCKTCGIDPRKYTEGCQECDGRKQADEAANVLVEQSNIAQKAILRQTGGKRGVSGHIYCPACVTGRLAYAVARNGHIHAQCETDGCMNWME